MLRGCTTADENNPDPSEQPTLHGRDARATKAHFQERHGDFTERHWISVNLRVLGVSVVNPSACRQGVVVANFGESVTAPSRSAGSAPPRSPPLSF